MYLFQLVSDTKYDMLSAIYIPLCIYFNWSCSREPYCIAYIYIPLCIYFNDYMRVNGLMAFWFTFHYVSISTIVLISICLSLRKFTFHYVSISTVKRQQRKQQLRHLHSTMYLFQPCLWLLLLRWLCYLHSTMYLFQPHLRVMLHQFLRHLHSTMYLFQPGLEVELSQYPF